MSTPVEVLAGLVVGTVESVAPNEIRVLLDLDAPHSTALNSGTPAAFPRLNGYVLIPNEAGATVGFVSWMGIERSPYPKRSGLKDFALIELPFPLRKMSVSPLGTLTARRDRKTGKTVHELSRGVVAFPSIGDQVLIPTHDQIAAVVGANDPERRVWIGSSPMAADAKIQVDPDKLFGRHLAVLGNTGSGKSCSVAGLIRWSLDAARKTRSDSGREGPPNARFVVLDPNGEYAKAFQDIGDVRVFRPCDAENPFVLPAWLWNSHEWAAVAQAQPGTQRPLLMQALRNLRAGRSAREPADATVARQIHLYKSKFAVFLSDAVGNSYAGWPGNKSAATCVKNLGEVMRALTARVAEAERKTVLLALADAADALFTSHTKPDPRKAGDFYVNDFNILDFEPFRALFAAAEAAFSAVAEVTGSGEDDPVPFDISRFADYIDDLAADGTSNANLSSFISYLTLRIRALTANRTLGSVIAPEDAVTLADWLRAYVGDDGASNGQIAVIDLSLVPSEATHIVVAVFARLVFEAGQRYRKLSAGGEPLPTVLVMEEAHNFVRRGRDDEDGMASSARLCREAFERIAREGRKFGLGLVLSSQRPYELSPTILAQCNTFLLHRIVNDSDQDLVRRLVPDNVGGLLGDLPSLPSRQAILLGWATPVPVLVEMRELPETQRPWSDDPDFWSVWTGESARPIEWDKVADDWSGNPAAGE